MYRTQRERLQHRTFGVLEEAGEEELLCLIHMVIKPPRTSDELHALSTVLIELTNDQMIEIAIKRSVMVREDAVALLKDLDSLVEWVSADQGWRCREERPCVEVFLTDAGMAAAHGMLSKYGWPEGV